MTKLDDQLAGFHEYRARVYGWAYRVLQCHHDASDVTQEVFLRWWRAQGDLQHPTHPLGWLRRVTVNLAIDWARSAARQRQPAGQSAQTESPGQQAVRLETCHQLAEALAALTDRQRSVVVAKVFDGQTFVRIAQQMNLSASSVKTHYIRALTQLKSKLPQLGPGSNH